MEEGLLKALSVTLLLLYLVAINPEAYAFRMRKKPKSLSRTYEAQKLIAILLYIADQKQKGLDTVEQLFSRLRLPRKD